MSSLRDYVAAREHRQYRRRLDWQLAQEYEAKGLRAVARVTDRFVRLCEAEVPVILQGEQIVFLRTVEDLPAIFTKAEWDKIRREHYVHESGFVSNVCPNYWDTISVGLLKKREAADEWGVQMIDALIALADRYRAEAVRLGRTDIAEVLTRVPRYPARSFREALQFFRILHFALWLEGDYHVTVGRFDKYAYPYLERDIATGVLDESAALALLEDFLIRIVTFIPAFSRVITVKA